MNTTRRTALGGALALAGCGRRADADAQGAELFPTAAGAAGPSVTSGGLTSGGVTNGGVADARVPRLRDLAPFAFGNEVTTAGLDDPVYRRLARDHATQLSIGWEAKMEAVLQPDGSLRFDAADRIADFAAANGQKLMGAAVIWHVEAPDRFKALLSDRPAFARAYDGFIAGLLGHYRGRIRGWDVVNEPINDDGTALRDSLWSQGLGQETWMVSAFKVAQEADPDAVLFLNEGGQEIRPRKLDMLLRLVERLLRAGAPIGGLGAQLHVGVDMAPGDVPRCLNAMAQFGLPIHVSEFDCTLQSDRRIDLRSRADKLARQQAIYREALEAFAALPARQRFAFTVFGLRDRDSWLRIPPNAGDGTDAPLLFDDAGRPKPVFHTVADTLRRLRAA